MAIIKLTEKEAQNLAAVTNNPRYKKQLEEELFPDERKEPKLVAHQGKTLQEIKIAEVLSNEEQGMISLMCKKDILLLAEARNELSAELAHLWFRYPFRYWLARMALDWLQRKRREVLTGGVEQKTNPRPSIAIGVINLVFSSNKTS